MSSGKSSKRPLSSLELYRTKALTSSPCLTSSSTKWLPMNPPAPATNTLAIITPMPADIQPEIIRRITDDFYSLLNEFLDQFWKIQVFLRRNPFQNFSFKHVNPHADRVGECWFFNISSQVMGMIRFHDPQFQRDFLLSHSYRAHALMPAMESDQLLIIESG